MQDIIFSDATLPGEGALAILVTEDAERPPLFLAADEATGGALTRAAAADNFTFGRNRTCTLLAPGAGLSRIVLVGLGKASEVDPLVAQAAGSVAASALKGREAATIGTAGIPSELAANAAFGALLGSYSFDIYRTKPVEGAKDALRTLTFAVADPGLTEIEFAPLLAVAKGIFLTRDLVSEPANILTPEIFAERTAELTKDGLEVEILDRARMKELGFGALLGVAQGSETEPRTVILRWNGSKKPDAPVVFVGKGVTFDSGGISIKPAAGMEDMKWDMAGAGTVVGLMSSLARRKARVNAVGIIGLVENMLSGAAQRPGDVVRSYSGQTIEVLNTDAEGRLVLADLLWYAQENFKPRFMVDLATLTGAIIVSLGHERAGLFSTDETLAKQISSIGEETGELVWRMPLGDSYDQLLKSDIADMKNIGGRPAGSITAAQFLKRFINDVPWAHLDIAGMAWASKGKPAYPKGATGYGVRLLDRLVRVHYES